MIFSNKELPEYGLFVHVTYFVHELSTIGATIHPFILKSQMTHSSVLNKLIKLNECAAYATLLHV